VLVVGVLAALLIGQALAQNRHQVELRMLDAAVRANQYENYLIAVSYYNANSRQPVAPFSREQWRRWRLANGLEMVR
jgi:hypothetical protein